MKRRLNRMNEKIYQRTPEHTPGVTVARQDCRGASTDIKTHPRCVFVYGARNGNRRAFQFYVVIVRSELGMIGARLLVTKVDASQ